MKQHQVQACLDGLVNYYDQQCRLYEAILEAGSRERELIQAGRFGELVSALQAKQDLVDQARTHDKTINAAQADISSFFGVEEFSIGVLRQVAPKPYQDIIHRLEQVVEQLLHVLGSLEEQEHEHEELLRAYYRKTQGQKVKADPKKAARAYERSRRDDDDRQSRNDSPS